MVDLGLPPSDEPFDFRRQASRYGTFRRDYSPALYDAIAARTGAGDGRPALDLGCGTGFVAAALARRGWRVVGADFSAPMLAAANAAGTALVRARAEALPLRDATVALVTCGTAFHWFEPVPALPATVTDLYVHPAAPFAGTGLEALPPLRIDATLAWTPASFHGYVSTVEWLRRMAGDRHAEFLDRVRDEIARRWPDGFTEPQHEYLFLARRPA